MLLLSFCQVQTRTSKGFYEDLKSPVKSWEYLHFLAYSVFHVLVLLIITSCMTRLYHVVPFPGLNSISWNEQESDGNKVVKDVIFGPGEKKYRFCKVNS